MEYTVEQKKRVLDRFCAPVESRQLDNGKVGLFDGVTGRQISEVSKRYELVQNRDVLLPFVNAFGVDRLAQLFSHQSGRSFYMSIDTGRDFDIGGGDIIKERFIVQNSYDKTRSFRFSLGAFRKVCSNDLYAFFAGVNYRKIHVGTIPVADLIAQGLNTFQSNNFSIWRNMREIPLAKEAGLEVVDAFEPFEVKEKHAHRWQWTQAEIDNDWIRNLARRNINAEEDLNNQRNLWGVYNGINAAIWRGVPDNSNISRVVTANKRLEDYLINTFKLN